MYEAHINPSVSLQVARLRWRTVWMPVKRSSTSQAWPRHLKVLTSQHPADGVTFTKQTLPWLQPLCALSVRLIPAFVCGLFSFEAFDAAVMELNSSKRHLKNQLNQSVSL